MSDICEGDQCPECGNGIMGFGDVENCGCHINPPCNACVTNPLRCKDCGYEALNEPEPIPTLTEQLYWKKYVDEWKAEQERWKEIRPGVEIRRIRTDGRSGSTMVCTGEYRGDLTPDDVLKYFGDGTFGHRGPYISPRGTFTYTMITD